MYKFDIANLLFNSEFKETRDSIDSISIIALFDLSFGPRVFNFIFHKTL